MYSTMCGVQKFSASKMQQQQDRKIIIEAMVCFEFYCVSLLFFMLIAFCWSRGASAWTDLLTGHGNKEGATTVIILTAAVAANTLFVMLLLAAPVTYIPNVWRNYPSCLE